MRLALRSIDLGRRINARRLQRVEHAYVHFHSRRQFDVCRPGGSKKHREGHIVKLYRFKFRRPAFLPPFGPVNGPRTGSPVVMIVVVGVLLLICVWTYNNL